MTTPLLFCNIGWMTHYEGLKDKPDDIVGGGKHVDTYHHGHEACNFLPCKDGNVYGYVDRSGNGKQSSINLERIGGTKACTSVEGVDVVWVATHPERGGRRVVGWYRDATVYREHQPLPQKLSKQHAKDGLTLFRIRAATENAYRLELHDRTLVLGTGRGWFGQANCWFADNNSSEELRVFLKRTRELIEGKAVEHNNNDQNFENVNPGSNSSGTATTAYTRYVRAYEISISPRHSELQDSFAQFVKVSGGTNIQPDKDHVDLRYNDNSRGLVLAEIKPCEKQNARFAIRTAIGQLLDYDQRCEDDALLLVVLEIKPEKRDEILATSNGFGLAYPAKDGFNIVWPKG